MAGRKSRHQLVLSVLLLPVGGGEDDIDIGAGVLGLGGGGVAGPGHGGGGGPWRVRWSSWLVSQLSQHVIKLHTNCVRRKTIIKSTVIALILANIH